MKLMSFQARLKEYNGPVKVNYNVVSYVQGDVFRPPRNTMTSCSEDKSLRKHAYTNIKKISSSKTENCQIKKNQIIFKFLPKT